MINGVFRRLYMLHGPHVDHARLVSLIEKEIDPLNRLDSKMPIYTTNTDPDSDVVGQYEALPLLIRKAINIDMSIQGSMVKIVFDMTDPKTGLVVGFSFERGLMRLKPVSTQRPHKRNKGRPVDLISKPSLRSYGEFRKGSGERRRRGGASCGTLVFARKRARWSSSLTNSQGPRRN